MFCVYLLYDIFILTMCLCIYIYIYIYIGENPIGGEGMIIICEIILRHLPKLTELDLSIYIFFYYFMNIHIEYTGCNSEVALPLSQLFLYSHTMEKLWICKLIYLFLLS